MLPAPSPARAVGSRWKYLAVRSKVDIDFVAFRGLSASPPKFPLFFRSVPEFTVDYKRPARADETAMADSAGYRLRGATHG